VAIVQWNDQVHTTTVTVTDVRLDNVSETVERVTQGLQNDQLSHNRYCH